MEGLGSRLLPRMLRLCKEIGPSRKSFKERSRPQFKKRNGSESRERQGRSNGYSTLR